MPNVLQALFINTDQQALFFLAAVEIVIGPDHG